MEQAEFEVYVKNVGEHIVQLRQAKGLTQVELASRMDIEDSALRRIEKGRTNPTLKTLYLIAHELEVPLQELFTID